MISRDHFMFLTLTTVVTVMACSQRGEITTPSLHRSDGATTPPSGAAADPAPAPSLDPPPTSPPNPAPPVAPTPDPAPAPLVDRYVEGSIFDGAFRDVADANMEATSVSGTVRATTTSRYGFFSMPGPFGV